MQNSTFLIKFDENNGFVTDIVNLKDEHFMNWCAPDGNWGRIHKKNWDAGANNLTGAYGELESKKTNLCHLTKR